MICINSDKKKQHNGLAILLIMRCGTLYKF